MGMNVIQAGCMMSIANNRVFNMTIIGLIDLLAFSFPSKGFCNGFRWCRYAILLKGRMIQNSGVLMKRRMIQNSGVLIMALIVVGVMMDKKVVRATGQNASIGLMLLLSVVAV